jgi:hypothetical protein
MGHHAISPANGMKLAVTIIVSDFERTVNGIPMLRRA